MGLTDTQYYQFHLLNHDSINIKYRFDKLAVFELMSGVET